MKKAFSFFLCAIMLVTVLSGLAACTTPEDPGEPPLREDGYYPNITLTLNNISYVQYLETFDAMGWSLTKNPYMDLIKDEFGIKFKLDIDVQDIGIYFEKLAANIATGKFADITCIGDSYFGVPNLKTANQNGLLTDLTEFVNGTNEKVKPSEDVLAVWEQAGESIFYPGTFDGQIKTLPWVQDFRADTNAFLYIRKDWLDAVGMSEPTNIAEMTDIMRAFKNNIDGAYGLTLDSGILNYPVFDMYGVNPMFWYEKDDGSVALGITNVEPMKKALTVLHDWYAEGLINSSEANDIAVIGGLHYSSQEIVNGKSGMHFGSLGMSFASNTLRKNKDARFVAVPIFPAESGYDVKIATKHSTYFYYAVGNNNKYPETAMKLYNFYLEVMSSEEEEYKAVRTNCKYTNAAGEEVEGWAASQFAPLRTNPATDIEASKEFLEKLWAKDSEGLNSAQLKTFNDYWEAVDSGTVNYKTYWMVEQNKENGVQMKLYDMYDNANFTRNIFCGIPTEGMDTYGAEIETALILDALSIIKGENPVEYWDAAVKNWLDGGGQVITDEVNAWWNGVNTK
ncbi:MAG: hypothetical protein IKA51_03550 [Clostridia bacterium]|nr:hypothetical protein [Clostridia bacterium]